MRITKAVITAAGRGARQYPAFDTVQKAMLPLVNRDGLTKPVLQIIAEEAHRERDRGDLRRLAPEDEGSTVSSSGASRPTSGRPEGRRLGRGTGSSDGRPGDGLKFAVQPEPHGYGHAVWCAREFVAGQPFLLLLGDHLYISGGTTLRTAVDRPRRSGGMRGLGGSVDPRAPDQPVRHDQRQENARPARRLRRSTRSSRSRTRRSPS